MEHILVVEDNKDVNDMLTEALTDAGYCVEAAYTGLEGMNKLKETKYDLILLDIMLPYLSGDEIVRQVREFSDIPIIIISAKDMISTKIDLLKLGADDYITKPFDLGEVVARVETSLRRTRRNEDKEMTLTYKDILLDTRAKRLILNGDELELTAKEYKIMELLLCNRNKIFSKTNLYETVWEEEYLGDDNAVKTHISNIRSKLKTANEKEEYIETVWGLGYRLFKE